MTHTNATIRPDHSNHARFSLGQICYRIFKSVLVWSILLSLTMVPSGAVAQGDADLADGLYAKMDTDRGTIVLKLFYKKTPLTVTNFAGLALGKMKTKVKKGEKFYDGLTFHRVIPDFMVQGGDPQGTGPWRSGIPVPGRVQSWINA